MTSFTIDHAPGANDHAPRGPEVGQDIYWLEQQADALLRSIPSATPSELAQIAAIGSRLIGAVRMVKKEPDNAA